MNLRWLNLALVLLVTPGATLHTGTAHAALPPRYDFSMEILLEGPILSLDPLRVRNRTELDAVGLLFEGLVEMTTTGPRPAAARGWDVTPDSLEWIFHLDPARRFGDGTPLRSYRVLAAWARARRDAPEWGWLFEGWTATTMDSVTVKIVVDRGVDDFPERLDLPGAAIALEVEHGGTKALSGTAPFRFAGRQPDGFILAPRLDDPRGRPYAGRLLLRTPAPGAASRKAWNDAAVAVADAALPDRTPQGAVIVDRGADSVWLLLVNSERPALGAAQRGALAAAIDRRRLAATLPAAGLAPRGAWREGSNETGAPRRSTATTGAGLRLLCEQGDPVAVALAEELAAQLGVAPAPIESPAARQAVRQGQYDLAIVRWDPCAAGELGRSELMHRPEMDRLTPAGRSAPAPASKRLGFWQSEAVLLPLVDRPNRVVRSDALAGFGIDPLTGALRLADAWPAEPQRESKSP